MTIPQQILEKTASSTPTIDIPDEAAVILLPIPGDLYMIRSEKGQRETLISQYDLSAAKVGGSPVSPSWSDAHLVIETYRLDQLVETCESILVELFGEGATVKPGIANDPESFAPSLILWLSVPRSMRNLRHAFLDRYVRETVIPEGAPAPALLWEYQDAVSA